MSQESFCTLYIRCVAGQSVKLGGAKGAEQSGERKPTTTTTPRETEEEEEEEKEGNGRGKLLISF